MQIDFVGASLSPGGAERLLLEEAKYFSSEGHKVRILVPESNDSFVSELGAEDIPIRDFGEQGFTSTVRWLRKRIVSADSDLVVSHYQDQACYLATRRTAASLSCHKNGSPFWFIDNENLLPHRRKPDFGKYLNQVEGHKNFQNFPSLSLKRRLRAELSELLQKKAVEASCLVTTLTNQVANELEFCYGRKPKVVRPGVPSDFMSSQEDVKTKRICDTEYSILNVGRLDSRKRNSLLLHAFSKLLNRREDVTLILGGTGSEREKLEKKAAELEIENSVEFAGYIPEKELASYYKSADLLAHPAWVAYGLVPLEAYVMGASVAISTDTLVKEIIGGYSGVSTIPPESDQWAEEMDKLLDSEKKTEPDRVPTWTNYCESKYEALLEAVT